MKVFDVMLLKISFRFMFWIYVKLSFIYYSFYIFILCYSVSSAQSETNTIPSNELLKIKTNIIQSFNTDLHSPKGINIANFTIFSDEVSNTNDKRFIRMLKNNSVSEISESKMQTDDLNCNNCTEWKEKKRDIITELLLIPIIGIFLLLLALLNYCNKVCIYDIRNYDNKHYAIESERAITFSKYYKMESQNSTETV